MSLLDVELPPAERGRVMTHRDFSESDWAVIESEMRKPSGFGTLKLGMKIYPWQADIIDCFQDPVKFTQVTVSTPNGAGKSSGVVTALCAWWMAAFKKGKVVITSADAKQLEGQLLRALDPHLRAMAGCQVVTSPYYKAKTAGGGSLIAFSTNDAGRAEGWHKEDDVDGPLLMVVDEAKSVSDDIFTAIDRCSYNALLYVSSPGLMSGRFYESFTKNRELWRQFMIPLTKCPHISPDRINNFIKTHGINNPVTRSSIFGEFMEQDQATSYVFPLAVVTRCFEEPPKRQEYGGRGAFCDFAAGGDENVMAIREGNYVRVAANWRERDTMLAVARFATEFRRNGLEATEIWADEGGLGKPMCDALAQIGWEINRVNNGEKPQDDVYKNRGSEIWHETAAAMLKGELRVEPDDELKKQLTSRHSIVTTQAKLAVESKEEMRRRGVKSPDRADAVCGAWACRDVTVGRTMKDTLDEWREQEGVEEYPEGAWAG